jgi:hypothetical protein
MLPSLFGCGQHGLLPVWLFGLTHCQAYTPLAVLVFSILVHFFPLGSFLLS